MLTAVRRKLDQEKKRREDEKEKDVLEEVAKMWCNLIALCSVQIKYNHLDERSPRTIAREGYEEFLQGLRELTAGGREHMIAHIVDEHSFQKFGLALNLSRFDKDWARMRGRPYL